MGLSGEEVWIFSGYRLLKLYVFVHNARLSSPWASCASSPKALKIYPIFYYVACRTPPILEEDDEDEFSLILF